MTNTPKTSFLTPTKEFRRLSILSAIHHQPHASQHKIARQANLSSAMVNSYIRNLATQGLIEKKSRNQRDFNYFLTQTGKDLLFSLLMEYSAEVVQFYSGAKREISQRLAGILNGSSKTKVVLYGASDTCEIVLQALLDFPNTQVVGIIDGGPEKQGHTLQGYTILAPEDISTCKPEMIIITSFAKQDEIHKNIVHLEQKGIKIRRLTTI